MQIPGLHVTLKEHQIHALKWQVAAERDHGGGLNGHLPGLGKTIQILSLVCLDRVLHQDPWSEYGTLIIVPACVTVQWYDQIKEKTDLKGFLFYDRWRKGLSDYCEASEADLGVYLKRFDVVVTSYSTILIDSFFQRKDVTWFRIVVDEVHGMRNVTSKRFKALLELRGRYKWGLSGTLLMNSPMDLFGPMQFIGLWHKAQAAKFAIALQRGHIAKHVLESSKDDIANLQLPPLTLKTTYVTLDYDWEVNAYKALLKSTRMNIQNSIAANANGSKKTKAHIFAIIMKLRQAANSVPLIDPVHEERVSAKCAAVLRLIQEHLTTDPTSKFILFSNFTQLLHLYARLFASNSISALMYYGEMNPKQREDALTLYKEGDETNGEEYSVLLASTPCANAGINITEANIVILNDLSYNPSTDEQCIARSHRIGQMRPVTVYRILAKDTIDERILAIQNKKKWLIHHVMKKSESDMELIKELVR